VIVSPAPIVAHLLREFRNLVLEHSRRHRACVPSRAVRRELSAAGLAEGDVDEVAAHALATRLGAPAVQKR